MLVVFAYFASKGHPLFTQVQQTLGRLNTTLQEVLIGIYVIKTFVREPLRERFDGSNRALRDINLRVGRMFAFAMPSHLYPGPTWAR